MCGEPLPDTDRIRVRQIERYLLPALGRFNSGFQPETRVSVWGAFFIKAKFLCGRSPFREKHRPEDFQMINF